MNKKILVIAHIFYHDLWEVIRDKLKNLKGYDFDLLVSTTSNIDELKKKVLKDFPSACFKLSENRGFDIWPFIKVLRDVDLSQYDYVIKVHTKRDMGKTVAIVQDKYYFRGCKWRDNLLSFISSKENLDKCIEAFENNKDVGMINCHRLFDITKENSRNPHLNYCFNEAKKLIESIGLHVNPDSYLKYIAGTMFICRSDIIKTLLKIELSADGFGPANRQNENDLAHVSERLFGWVTTSLGYKIVDPYTTAWDNFRYLPHCLLCRVLTFKLRHRYFSKTCRFIFRIDSDDNGTKSVKIFKICVFKYNKSDS
ncbi:MAG: rhamnan synthesis F family protein [Succinivibrio sp.]